MNPPADKPHILIANSDDAHREELLSIIGRLYPVKGFSNNAQVMDSLHTEKPGAVIVDDRMLATGRGCLFDKRKDDKLTHIPFIITGASYNPDFFANERDKDVDSFIQRPFSKNKIITELSKSLSVVVERKWEELPPQQRTVLQNTVHEFQNLSKLIEEKKPLDLKASQESCEPLVQSINNHEYEGILENVKGHHNYTYVHSLRVATFLSIFGHAIGIRGDDLRTLATGGLLHDVGKMVTPQDVLNKNGKLDENEWPVMKGHVEHSSDILDRTPGVTAGIRIIAEQHHEKLDGTGYPLGLQGSELNELARMSAIVDIFGALTDERSYKPAFPPEKAFAILEDMEDGLDQSLVKVFRDVLEAGDGA